MDTDNLESNQIPLGGADGFPQCGRGRSVKAELWNVRVDGLDIWPPLAVVVSQRASQSLESDTQPQDHRRDLFVLDLALRRPDSVEVLASVGSEPRQIHGRLVQAQPHASESAVQG